MRQARHPSVRAANRSLRPDPRILPDHDPPLLRAPRPRRLGKAGHGSHQAIRVRTRVAGIPVHHRAGPSGASTNREQLSSAAVRSGRCRRHSRTSGHLQHSRCHLHYRH
eukprot:11197441-Heterocapsa_arctica.AAC.1